MTIFEESKGVHSMRRTLALLSFGNAIALAWKPAAWEVIAIFAGATLVLLGLTTIGDLANLKSVSGKSIDIPDGEVFGKPERLGE